MTDKTAVATKAFGFVSGVCASRIAKTVIINNLAEPETTSESIQIALGCMAIGGIVGEACATNSEAAFRRTTDQVKQLFKKNSDQK